MAWVTSSTFAADFFAEIGDHVGIADFQREEGIRGVLE